MSSIPLPALNVKPPPQQEGPLDQYSKAMALRNMMQRQQMGQQQMQMGDVQLQQQQLQLKDQQTMRQIASDPSIDWGDPKSLDTLVPKFARAGVSPQTLIPLQQHMTEQRQKLATLDKTKFETQQAMLDNVFSSARTLQALPPDQRPAAYQQLQQNPMLQTLVKNGVIPQQSVPQQYDEAEVNSFIGGLGISHSMTTAVARERQAATGESRLAAEQPGLEAKSAQAQRANYSTMLAGSKDQADYDAKRGKLPYELAKQFPDQFERNAVLKAGQTPEQIVSTEQGAQRVALEGQQVGIARQRLGIAQKDLQLKYFQNGFDSSGNPISNENASPLARQIVAGKMDPATYRATMRRQPGLMNQVLALDPNFDETSVDRRFAFNKQLTNMNPSGIGGQSLALNTLVHHSDLLYDMVDGLQNGSFTPGNKLFNNVRTTFGNAPVPNFNSVRDFVVSEAAKLAHGGVPNEADINRSIENLKSAGSPAQLKGGIDKILTIAGGKMQAINEQGQQAGMGPNFTVLGNEAKQIVQKHGIDPATLKPAQQGGQQGGGGGTAVSLAAAKQLPANKGKTDAQIRQDIQAHGHQVAP